MAELSVAYKFEKNYDTNNFINGTLNNRELIKDFTFPLLDVKQLNTNINTSSDNIMKTEISKYKTPINNQNLYINSDLSDQKIINAHKLYLNETINPMFYGATTFGITPENFNILNTDISNTVSHFNSERTLLQGKKVPKDSNIKCAESIPNCVPKYSGSDKYCYPDYINAQVGDWISNTNNYYNFIMD